MDAETKARIIPCGSSLSWVVGNDTWHGKVINISPGGESRGYIPAPIDGEVVALDIEAHMNEYNNQGGTGEVAFKAPQEVEYEVWVFLRKGGRVLKVISDAPAFSGGTDLRVEISLGFQKGRPLAVLDASSVPGGDYTHSVVINGETVFLNDHTAQVILGFREMYGDTVKYKVMKDFPRTLF